MQHFRGFAVHAEERFLGALHIRLGGHLPFMRFQHGCNLHYLLPCAGKGNEHGVSAYPVTTHQGQLRQVVFLRFLRHGRRIQVVLHSSIKDCSPLPVGKDGRGAIHQFACRRQSDETVVAAEERTVGKRQRLQRHLKQQLRRYVVDR